MQSTELQKGMTVALLMYLSCAGATAQSDAPRFEVASIRPAAIREPAAGERRGGQGGASCGAERFVMDGSIARYSCVSLSALIAHAFHIPIIGPDWMSQISPPKFDIVAKIPDGVSNAQVPEMFQTLLADRFKLIVHRGTQDQNVLALVVDRGGPKLKPASTEDAVPGPDPGATCPGGDGGCIVRIRNVDGEQVILTETSPGITSYSSPSIGTALRTALPADIVTIRTEAPSTTLVGLAILASLLPTNQPPIVDMTGIAGRYDVAIEVPLYVKATNGRLGPLTHAAEVAGRDGTPEGEAWRAAVMEEATNAGIVAQQALEADLRKLGLRLEPRRIPMGAIVVDHVEKSPTEN